MSDLISKELFDQIKWERDIAIGQLKELGYGLGEKIRTDKDMISRQAAIDAMMALQAEDYEAYGCRIPEGFDGERAKEVLEQLPSAQPVIRGVIDESGRIKFIEQSERNKGKWIVHPEVKNVYGGTYIECPQCGEKYVVQHMEDEKYCRNCGAKMEE